MFGGKLHMQALRDAAMQSKAWPIEEARRVLQRYATAPPAKGHVLFETGYGPSGLPHLGTFGEVARTTMIRRAFEVISDIPTRLICFSDDVDGMRKVPENVPNQDMLRQHMQQPLTSVPDPYALYDSFGAHNNAMLRRFLDMFVRGRTGDHHGDQRILGRERGGQSFGHGNLPVLSPDILTRGRGGNRRPSPRDAGREVRAAIRPLRGKKHERAS